MMDVPPRKFRRGGPAVRRSKAAEKATGRDHDSQYRDGSALRFDVASVCIGFSAASVSAQTKGVTKDEILIGVPIDLSGPLAEVGRQGQAGARMAEEEINAAGGINGRKLKILYEDQQYDAKKTVLVTQKLIEQDKVFAIWLTYGTGPAAAAYPMVLKSGTPHVCPSTASIMFAEPMERLSFQCFPSYGAMSAAGVKTFLEKEGKKKVCLHLPG